MERRCLRKVTLVILPIMVTFHLNFFLGFFSFTWAVSLTPSDKTLQCESSLSQCLKVITKRFSELNICEKEIKNSITSNQQLTRKKILIESLNGCPKKLLTCTTYKNAVQRSYSYCNKLRPQPKPEAKAEGYFNDKQKIGYCGGKFINNDERCKIKPILKGLDYDNLYQKMLRKKEERMSAGEKNQLQKHKQLQKEINRLECLLGHPMSETVVIPQKNAMELGTTHECRTGLKALLKPVKI